MKLVFLINSTKNIGGGDYAQFVFAHELTKRGHDITIFSGDKNFYSPELENSSLKAFYRKTIPVFTKGIGLGKLNLLWEKIYTFLVIKPYLKKHKPDVIIGYLRSSAILAQKLGSEHNIKIVNFVFENPKWMEEDLGDLWLEEWQNTKFRNSWLNTKVAYEKSDILIPNSKLSGKKMKEWIPTANISDPVYPGIEGITKKKKSKNRDIDVVYLGRLSKLKHVDVLLKAAKPEWKIVLMGADGGEQKYLEQLSQELGLHVTFAGSVSDEEKENILARSKVLATATSHEGFGMAPLDALLQGCRVVCSNLPIFKEVYDNEVTYFELHDHNDLRKKIEVELKKPPTNSKLMDKYTWEKAAKKIEEILSK